MTLVVLHFSGCRSFRGWLYWRVVRWVMGLIWRRDEITRISPLHGRFPISNREEARAEAVMKERANLEKTPQALSQTGKRR